MKKIKLTKNQLAVVDDKDFEYLNQFHWSVDGSGYPQRATKTIKGWRPIRMHRDLFKLIGKETADHINLNKLDNRRKNLRRCNQAQNNRNIGITKNNTSGYKGVWLRNDKKRSKRWVAEITFNDKKNHLGSFERPEQAALAYNNAAKKYFGEFAVLNPLE